MNVCAVIMDAHLEYLDNAGVHLLVTKSRAIVDATLHSNG